MTMHIVIYMCMTILLRKLKVVLYNTKTMKKIEYFVEKIRAGWLQEDLDIFAENDWELVTIFDNRYWIFKKLSKKAKNEL